MERRVSWEEKAYGYWLHNLPGIGDRTISRLLQAFGSARNIHQAGSGALKGLAGEKRAAAAAAHFKAWDVEKRYEELERKNILFLSLEEEGYPARLRAMEYPPYALYCLGSLPEEKAPAAAVIGARECSQYGCAMARAFAGKMAAAGVVIISGMARGIDGIAQNAALAWGGRTFAVLGSGVDVCYPESNRDLYRKIQETGGGILSVFPPGTRPLKQHFPERNRIVAGLSDVLVVVEARLKSGTQITVDMALEQGKNVYAVPGRLTDRLSDGCNFLIRQGAGIALTPEDILSELSVLQNRKGAEGKASAGQKEAPALQEGKAPAGEMAWVLSFLDAYPKSADEILLEMRDKGKQASLPWLLEKLICLCMENKAKQTGGSYFVAIYDR